MALLAGASRTQCAAAAHMARVLPVSRAPLPARLHSLHGPSRRHAVNSACISMACASSQPHILAAFYALSAGKTQVTAATATVVHVPNARSRAVPRHLTEEASRAHTAAGEVAELACKAHMCGSSGVACVRGSAECVQSKCTTRPCMRPREAHATKQFAQQHTLQLHFPSALRPPRRRPAPTQGVTCASFSCAASSSA